jgi:hypothetical protein
MREDNNQNPHDLIVAGVGFFGGALHQHGDPKPKTGNGQGQQNQSEDHILSSIRRFIIGSKQLEQGADGRLTLARVFPSLIHPRRETKMRNRLLKIAPALAMAALAGQLWAGGFFLTLGNPEANPEARRLNAVLTIQAAGCHDPAAAAVTATAIGTVNGERREIPLKLEKLSGAGMFALTQQWPKEGRWVLRLVGKNGEQYTNTLVAAGPEGIDRYHGKADMKAFTDADVDAMLR